MRGKRGKSWRKNSEKHVSKSLSHGSVACNAKSRPRIPDLECRLVLNTRASWKPLRCCRGEVRDKALGLRIPLQHGRPLRCRERVGCGANTGFRMVHRIPGGWLLAPCPRRLAPCSVCFQAHRTLCDGVVVLAHMDFRDALVDKIWAAVRQGMGPSKPIQILAGHSHIRGYRRGPQLSCG